MILFASAVRICRLGVFLVNRRRASDPDARGQAGRLVHHEE